MRGSANAEGAAGRVRGVGCWLPRDALEGVLMDRILFCWLEVERGFRGVRLAGLGGSGLFGDAAYIMVPTCWRGRETGEFLLGVYGGYLAEACVAVAGNGDWRLLRRGLRVLEVGLG